MFNLRDTLGVPKSDHVEEELIPIELAYCRRLWQSSGSRRRRLPDMLYVSSPYIIRPISLAINWDSGLRRWK